MTCAGKRLPVVGVLVVAATLLAPVPRASAGVTVNPSTAIPGQTAVLNFAVSDDRPDSSTTRVELHLPQGSFTTTAAQPKAGWQTAAGTSGGIVWTAVDPTAVIGPGQFDVFSVELGPLPTGTDRLAFDVAQTYADGQVVDWADGSDAAHPAPVVQLRQIAGAAMIAAPADPPQMAQPPAAAVAAAVEPAPKPDNSRRVTAGLTLGIVLILLGAAAAAVQQRRRPAETD